MALSDVYLVSDKLDLAIDAEVVAAEQDLGTRLPTGYRAYVTLLGAGTLNDNIRLIMPADIVRETQAFHETAAVFAVDDTEIYDLFESGLDLLPPSACAALCSSGRPMIATVSSSTPIRQTTFSSSTMHGSLP